MMVEIISFCLARHTCMMVENVSFCLARRICMIAENKYHEGKGIKNED